MATKSFLKTIDIKNKKLAKDFVHALENAENKTAKEVVVGKKVKHMSREEIRSIFRNGK